MSADMERRKVEAQIRQEVVRAWGLADAYRADANRYRWLRAQQWDSSALCVVVGPKENVRLGSFCPSGDQLDAAIDAAMRLAAPE